MFKSAIDEGSPRIWSAQTCLRFESDDASPQFFLLAYLDRKEVLTMSEIAKKMGHTTAAASGLVARLENLRFVMRSAARDDRRKVMVCITPKGSALVRRIREAMVGNIMKILNHLTPDEQKAWF